MKRSAASALLCFGLLVAASNNAYAIQAQKPVTPAQKAEALEFFERMAKYLWITAQGKAPFPGDPLSVRLNVSSQEATILEKTEREGCVVTFANNAAMFGAGRSGRGTITIDWSQVQEIDGSGSEDQRGTFIRGGISNNFAPKHELRAVASDSGTGSNFLYFADIMQRACQQR